MKKNIEYIKKKHPLTIGQANRVAKEFGNFDRNSIYLFDYVTSCLPYNQKLSYRTNVITVTAKELYNLLFGYVSRKILTDKQFNSLNSAVTKMLSTPLQLKNSEHYLFTKTVNQTVENNLRKTFFLSIILFHLITLLILNQLLKIIILPY